MRKVIKMRTAKPSQEIIQRRQKEEQKRQEIEQVKKRFKEKDKRDITQDDINDLVLVMAKQQGLIED